MVIWARKSFPDGSRIKSATRESWFYIESDGHSVEVIVDYARRSYIIYLPSLSTWRSPAGETISPAKKEEIINKFKAYLGPDNVRVE
jgi:hypothetical protein